LRIFGFIRSGKTFPFTIMKNITRSILLAAILLLAGCRTSNGLVPKTIFDLRDQNGKHIRLEAPKDLKADKISITRNEDGLPTVTIEKLDARTNPEVIGAAGAAQSDAIKASGELILKAIDKGIQLAPVPK
jgi:hypothetical protein